MFKWILSSLVLFWASDVFAKVNIVTTTADLAAVARDVVQDLGDVQAIAAPNQDVHYVDAKPSFTLLLNKADILVANGLELEIGWLPALIENARNPKIAPGGTGYLDASTAIRPLHVHAKVDRAKGDIHPGGNPHYMHDPRAAADVALVLGAKLAQIDPKHAADYRLNAARAAEAYRELAKSLRARVEALPKEKQQIVAYHDSLVYILDWLGLTQVATLEPRPGIAPNPSHIASVLKTSREAGVKVIVQEEYYPRKTSETLAQLLPANLVLLPGGARSNESYEARIKRGIDEVLKHLETP